MIWLRQNSFHLRRVQISRSVQRRLLGRNAQDLGALLGGVRLSAGHEPKEAAQCGQTAVTCADGVAALLLGILEESCDFRADEVLQPELSHSPVTAPGNEPQEQAPRIAV